MAEDRLDEIPEVKALLDEVEANIENYRAFPDESFTQIGRAARASTPTGLRGASR